MTTQSRRLTWTPPSTSPGAEVTFSGGAPYVFIDLEGDDSADVTPVGRRLGTYAGEEALNFDAAARVLTAQVGLIGSGAGERAQARRSLIRSLASEPITRDAQALELGRLTYWVPGVGTFETDALPRGGFQSAEVDDTRTLEEGSIEFWTPTPWWRAKDALAAEFISVGPSALYFESGDTVLEEADLLLRARNFTGSTGDPWENEGTAGDALDAVAVGTGPVHTGGADPYFTTDPTSGGLTDYYHTPDDAAAEALLDPGPSASFTAVARFKFETLPTSVGNVLSKIQGTMGAGGSGWQIIDLAAAIGGPVTAAIVGSGGSDPGTDPATIGPTSVLGTDEHTAFIRLDRTTDTLTLVLDGTAYSSDASAVGDISSTNLGLIFGRGTHQRSYDYAYWSGRALSLAEMASVQEALEGTDGPDELAFPWATVTDAASAVVTNPGDVSCPVQITMVGDFTTGTIQVIETGERLTITDQITAGQEVVIDTTPGQRSVTIDGVAALDRLELSTASFFQLPPGDSTIVFGAVSNVSGFPIVEFKPLFSGV